MAIAIASRSRVTFLRCVFASLISMLCVANATAFPVTYTETATIDGSLDGIAFFNTEITITGSGDTDNIVHGMPCCFRNELGANTVTFDLAGFGTGVFTDLIAVVVNQTNTGGIPGEPETGISGAGFSDFTSFFLILWTLDPAFGSWDLSTDIGPLIGPGFCNCDPTANISFPTTLGTAAHQCHRPDVHSRCSCGPGSGNLASSCDWPRRVRGAARPAPEGEDH